MLIVIQDEDDSPPVMGRRDRYVFRIGQEEFALTRKPMRLVYTIPVPANTPPFSECY